MSNRNLMPNGEYGLCPLYSFSCYKTEVRVSNFTKVICAPIEFKDWMKKQFPISPIYTVDDPTDFDWVLFISNPNETSSQKEDCLSNVLGFSHWFMTFFIWALRLHKKGNITPGTVHFVKKDDSRIQRLSSLENTLCKNGFNKKPFYNLTEKDFIHVSKLFDLLQTCFKKDLPAPFSTVFDRFNSSYYEKAEDALIDQIIAFESLLIDDDKELGYKLALRTAFLIGKNKETVFNNMKQAYNLRSSIVHGKKRVSNSELLNILPITEGYLRQVIIAFLTLLAKGKSINTIRHVLDLNILNNNRTIKKELTF